MLRLEEFKKENYKDYIELYREFIDNNSDLVPDILDLKCDNEEDYDKILEELENRKNGNHADKDWYFDGHYYMAYDDDRLVGLGCIRNNLTPQAYDIWGHIAAGVRPSERGKGYATKMVEMLTEEAGKLGIEEVIYCHYEQNKISPKILNRLGVEFINTVTSPYSGKTIYRYGRTLKKNKKKA